MNTKLESSSAAVTVAEQNNVFVSLLNVSFMADANENVKKHGHSAHSVKLCNIFSCNIKYLN